MAGLDGLGAVCQRWTIDQVLDAHDLLDLREQAEADAMRGAGAA